MGAGRTGEPQANQRLTVAQAAASLGITEGAVRSRIKRGTLTTAKEGGAVFVMLGDGTSQANQTPNTDVPGDQLVAQLLDRVASLERQLERREDETERLHQIIGGLAQANAEQARTIRAIEGPSEAPGDAETVEEAPEEASPRRPAAGPSADGPTAGIAAREVGQGPILPRPREDLSFWWYAGVVTAAVGLYWVGTWPLVFSSFPPAAVLTFTPVFLGIWLGLNRRGRPYWIYGLTALLVGLLTMSVLVIEALIVDGRDFVTVDWNWFYTVPFYFVVPALLVMSGALFGDAIKRRVWSESVTEPQTDLDTTEPVRGLSVQASFVLGLITSILGSLILGGAQVWAAYIERVP